MKIVIIFRKKIFQKVSRVESEIKTTQNKQDPKQLPKTDKQDDLEVDPSKKRDVRSQEHMGQNILL